MIVLKRKENLKIPKKQNNQKNKQKKRKQTPNDAGKCKKNVQSNKTFLSFFKTKQ